MFEITNGCKSLTDVCFEVFWLHFLGCWMFVSQKIMDVWHKKTSSLTFKEWKTLLKVYDKKDIVKGHWYEWSHEKRVQKILPKLGHWC